MFCRSLGFDKVICNFIWFYLLGYSDPYVPAPSAPTEEVKGETKAPATFQGLFHLLIIEACKNV